MGQDFSRELTAEFPDRAFLYHNKKNKDDEDEFSGVRKSIKPFRSVVDLSLYTLDDCPKDLLDLCKERRNRLTGCATAVLRFCLQDRNVGPKDDGAYMKMKRPYDDELPPQPETDKEEDHRDGQDDKKPRHEENDKEGKKSTKSRRSKKCSRGRISGGAPKMSTIFEDEVKMKVTKVNGCKHTHTKKDEKSVSHDTDDRSDEYIWMKI